MTTERRAKLRVHGDDIRYSNELDSRHHQLREGRDVTSAAQRRVRRGTTELPPAECWPRRRPDSGHGGLPRRWIEGQTDRSSVASGIQTAASTGI